MRFGWARLWCRSVIFQSAVTGPDEEIGNGTEISLDLCGGFFDAGSDDWSSHLDPFCDASGWVIAQSLFSRQGEDVAVGGQHEGAGIIQGVHSCLQASSVDGLALGG